MDGVPFVRDTIHSWPVIAVFRMEEFHDSEIRGQKLYDFNCFSFLRFVMELLVTIYQNRISMMGIFGNGDRNGNNEKIRRSIDIFIEFSNDTNDPLSR